MAFAATYHDGTTIKTFIEGVGLVNTIQTVSWTVSNDRTKVVGTGQKHVGVTPGVTSVDSASMEMTLSDFQQVLGKLGQNSQAVLMNKVFDVTITCAIAGHPPIVTVLRDCSVTSIDNSHNYGDATNLTVSLELMVLGIDNSSLPMWNTVNVPFGA